MGISDWLASPDGIAYKERQSKLRSESGGMLERKFDENSGLEFIEPLEEVYSGRSTDFQTAVVPTEQGEMLLEFLRRQLFSKR